MRHRSDFDGRAARVAGIISRNPRESVALFAATAAISIIFANALFMQPGPHPAPIFASRTAAPVMPRPMKQQPAAVPAPLPRPEAVAHAMPPKAEPRHNDPIANLLAPSNRVLAAQRVLTSFGYGQIRPTGIVGPETQEAIRKFERSRRLPVTGNLSDQVVRALSELSGQPIE